MKSSACKLIPTGDLIRNVHRNTLLGRKASFLLFMCIIVGRKDQGIRDTLKGRDRVNEREREVTECVCVRERWRWSLCLCEKERMSEGEIEINNNCK